MLLPHDDHLDHLGRATDAFAGALRAGALDAPVPGCPDWTLLDLAHHLGGVHRWARTAVLEGRPDGDRGTDTAPTDRDGVVAWFAEGAADLHATLSATDPDAPCWHFGPKPRTAAFWVRRQSHETVVHALDAAAAAGVEPLPLPGDLARDGVDEVVTLFVPRQQRSGRLDGPRSAVAIEVDEGGRWVLGADGTDSTDGTAGADGPDGVVPAATVRGPAAAVLLALWHRDGPEALTVDGDRDAAAAWWRAPVTP